MNRLVCAAVVLISTTASAHKRPASTISIEIRDEQHLLAGTTFGAVTSDDGGATWQWTCEQGLHYQDPFDPDYAYAPDGAILEQTSVAMWLKRDTCGDDVMPIAVDVSAVEAGPDGALYAAAYDGSIYKAASSTAAFTAIPAPASVVQWTSIEVAPGDAQRIYLAGFRMNGTAKEHVLVMSANGGTSWSPMSGTGFPTGSSSLLYVADIGPASDTLYVYSPYEDDDSAAIYKSTNAGGTWTKIFSSTDPYGLAFLARRSGELVVATRASGAFHSTNGGTSWEPLAGAPHISALAESPAGEVWAGTQPVTQLPPPMNPQLPTIEGDGYLLMHSADLATWSPGVAVSALLPTSCASGPVRQACIDMRYDLGTAWCCLVSEYQVDPADLDCRGANWCGGYQDAGVVGGDVTKPPDPGCCDAGAAGTSVPMAAILLILLRRGRTRVRRAVGHGQRR